MTLSSYREGALYRETQNSTTANIDDEPRLMQALSSTVEPAVMDGRTPYQRLRVSSFALFPKEVGRKAGFPETPDS
jgi:hypothetical protein